MYRTHAGDLSDAEHKTLSIETRTNDIPRKGFRGDEGDELWRQIIVRMEENTARILFLSDGETSAAARARKEGLQDLVRADEVPPTNLKELVRTGCTTGHSLRHPVLSAGPEARLHDTAVVYFITCSQCGEGYIGNMSSPLRTINEQFGLRTSKTSTL